MPVVKRNRSQRDGHGCETCGKRYSRLEYLKRHQRRHESKRDFGCILCNKTFTRSDVLLQHQRQCHPLQYPSTISTLHSIASTTAIPDQRDTPGFLHADLFMTGGVAGVSGIGVGRDNEPIQREEQSSRPGDGGYNTTISTTDIISGSRSGSGVQRVHASGEAEKEGCASIAVRPRSEGDGHGSNYTSNGLTSSSINFSLDQLPIDIIPEIMHRELYVGAGNALTDDQNTQEGLYGNWVQAVELYEGTFPGNNLPPESTQDAWSGPSLNNTYPMRQLSPDVSLSAVASQNITKLSQTTNSTFNVEGWTPQSQFLEWAQEIAQPCGWSHLPASAIARTSPYPEIPLLRILGEEKRRRFGEELDMFDPFFISYARYHQCYEVPHWEIPSARTMKRIAKQSMFTLTQHLPIVHLAHSRLEQIHPGLAFAMMIVGSPRRSSIAGDLSRKWLGLGDEDGERARLADAKEWEEGRSVVSPWTDAEVEIVVKEKQAMMRTAFSSYCRALSPDLVMGLFQSLVFLTVPLLLSPEPAQRAIGYDEFTTNIFHARSARILEPDITWRHTTTWNDTLGSSDHALMRKWKQWIEQEARRRTIWLLYLFDTLKVVETRGTGLISPPDVGCLLLPAPDPVWTAESHHQWQDAMATYTPVTLVEAMQAHYVPNESDLSANATQRTGFSCLYSLLGRFARLLVVLTLLRELILFGEGKSDAGSLLTAWGISLHDVSPKEKNIFTMVAFGSALSRWLQGWQLDPLCAGNVEPMFDTGSEASIGSLFPSSGVSQAVETINARSSVRAGNVPVSNICAKPVSFCEDAIPFYQLAHGLFETFALDPTLTTDPEMLPHAAGRNRLAKLDLTALLAHARALSRVTVSVV